MLLSGYLMDGNGSAMWTALGALIGFAVGQLVAVPMSFAQLGEEQLIPMLIGPGLFAILFYELTSDTSRREVEEKVGEGIEWRTGVAPTRDGAMVGISGRF